MSFPTATLVATGGSCYAHLFENRLTGLQRGLFWSFRLAFAPQEYMDETWQTSLTIEWMRIPIRDWRDLAGLRRAGEYGDEGVEATFYVFSHSPGTRFEIAIPEWRWKGSDANNISRGVELRVVADVTVDYPGYDGDADPSMKVHGDAWVDFEGLIVSGDALFPKLTSDSEAREALERFVDPAFFGPPAEGQRYWRPL